MTTSTRSAVVEVALSHGERAAECARNGLILRKEEASTHLAEARRHLEQAMNEAKGIEPPNGRSVTKGEFWVVRASVFGMPRRRHRREFLSIAHRHWHADRAP